MNPWTNNLPPFKGRRKTPLGPDTSVNLASSDYSGPADGDFARYVDQLLSNAESQRRLQTRAAPAAPSARDKARGNPQTLRQAAQPATKASPRAAAEAVKAAHAAKAAFALPQIKLFSVGMWLMAIVATIFFPGIAIWFVAALVVSSVIKGVRKGLSKS